jgi:WD40 repeat protein
MTSSKQPLATFTHENLVEGCAFSSDENRLLTWSVDGTARLWDCARPGSPLATFRHDQPVTGATFSPHEDKVLTWSKDGTVRLWDIGLDASIPISEQWRQFRIRSGTTLETTGVVRLLSPDELRKIKNEKPALAKRAAR